MGKKIRQDVRPAWLAERLLIFLSIFFKCLIIFGINDEELKMMESRACCLMVRRFVVSEEFESPFALKLLSGILCDFLGNSRKENFGNKQMFMNSNPVMSEVTTKLEEIPAPRLLPIKELEEEVKTKIESNEKAINVSNMSFESSTTVPFDFNNEDNMDIEDKADFDEIIGSEIEGEQTKTSINIISQGKVNKQNFFSSDSDSSCSNTSGNHRKDVKTEKRVVGKRNKNKNEKNELEGSDKENKELEKLLRMTDIRETKPKSDGNQSKSDEDKPKSSKKAVATDKEVSLLDCLENGETSEGETTVDPEEKKETDKEFLAQVNEEVKNIFFSSTSDGKSNESEPEPEPKAPEKEKKVLKRSERNKKTKSYRLSDFDSNSTDTETYSTESKDSSVMSISSTKPSSSDSEKNYSRKLKNDSSNKKKNKQKSGKVLDLSSDSSVEIEQIYCKTQSSPSKGRKNINKILKKDSLQLETKQALKAETERKKRLVERQKLYNKLFSSQNDCSLVLDFDPATEKELVVVDKNLAKKLKPHQKQGVKFMWNNCFESVDRLEEDSGSGCILAHCMGLGKTLQVVTLVHTVLTHGMGVRTVLVMCPLNTIKNWIHEFKYWLKSCREKIILFSLTSCKSQQDRISRVRQWERCGGVMVLGYQMLRTVIQRKGQTEKAHPAFLSGFLDPGPDLVVCDEGHILKNESSSLSKCLNQIKTQRRIILTGTPLQNNLIEYYCMVQFAKPNILGTRKEFMNRFVNPINNGQFEDSTELDVRIMKRRSHVLHTMLEGFIQRLNYSVLTPFLPEKQEYVISISLTESQSNAYRFFVETCLKENRGLFCDFNWIRKVWTHPLVLMRHFEKHKVDAPENKFGKSTDRPRDQKEFWSQHFKQEDYEELSSSGKLVLLFQILKKCKDVGDKVLVFSQFLDSLDLIEHFLRKEEQKHKSGPEVVRWTLGIDYFRMDGSTSSEDRDKYCNIFNNSDNKRSRLFLISTRAGGLGINLVGANRVVVFDASWNPSHDVQCIFRVYRFGQKKPCYIYRFLAAFTMEEKIYRRQVTKLSLAHRILDEHQIERHYSMGNLQELYIFKPVPKIEWKVPKIPKDSLFAEILGLNRNIIAGYHEHDSLLENKEEEELTEEERRVAWEEYEKEKPANIIAESFMEKLNVDALKVVQKYKTGLPLPNTSNNSFMSKNTQNQMCKVVDVRRIKEPDVSMTDSGWLGIGRSLGITPFKGEAIDQFLRRIKLSVQYLRSKQ